MRRYGQTGSGKSFTMFGKEKSDDINLKGIIPRSAGEIFARCAEAMEDANLEEIQVKCSFIEIYKEVNK